MSMQSFLGNMKDKGAYHQEAQRYKTERGDQVQPLEFFGWQAEQEGIAPTDSELKQAEDYWLGYLNVGEGEFTRREKVKALAADYWALAKAMDEAKVPCQGRGAATVDQCIGKQFATTTQQSIFPFFYDANIQVGLLTMPLLDRLVFETQTVESGTAVHLELTDTAWETGTATPVGEGARARSVVIRGTERTVYLQDFQSKAEITYKAARRMRLPLFARAIQRVGQRLMIDLTDFVIDKAISGDGANSSASTKAAATPTAPIYDDVIDALLTFPQAYSPNLTIWNATSLGKLLKMTEFKDPLAGFKFQNAGIYPTPLGMDLARWDVTGKVSGWVSTTGLMIDDRICMVGYQEGGMMTETERVIDGQFERAVTSMTYGAAVWDRTAALLLTSW
jgi:hypothetical protein